MQNVAPDRRQRRDARGHPHQPGQNADGRRRALQIIGQLRRWFSQRASAQGRDRLPGTGDEPGDDRIRGDAMGPYRPPDSPRRLLTGVDVDDARHPEPQIQRCQHPGHHRHAAPGGGDPARLRDPRTPGPGCSSRAPPTFRRRSPARPGPAARPTGDRILRPAAVWPGPQCGEATDPQPRARPRKPESTPPRSSGVWSGPRRMFSTARHRKMVTSVLNVRPRREVCVKPADGASTADCTPARIEERTSSA